MQVLIINPPDSASLNLQKFEERGMTVYTSHNVEDTIEILSSRQVDMALVFINRFNPAIFSILLSVTEQFPGVKLIALADQESSDAMTFFENLEFADVMEEAIELSQ